MNPRLLEIITRRKELKELVERAADMGELNKYKQELQSLQEEETLLIERARIAESLVGGGGKPLPTPANNAQDSKYDSIEYRNAFMNYVLSGGKKNIPVEYRAAGPSATSDIGAVIPSTIIQKIVEKLQACGMILREVTQTSLRGGVTYPQSTVKPVATWVAEGATSDKQKKTVTGITFAYHKLRCAVSMTLEAETVSLAVFEQAIIANIAEAMIIGLEKAIISGDGSGQPKGIIQEAVPADRTVTVTGALKYANVVSAEAALPQAYEPNAKWVMTKKTFMSFVGQTDDAGQPIARVNYGIAGAPERYILGRPVICCDYLEALSASTKKDTVVAFLFDLKNYAVNTNYQMGLKKYEDNETDDQVLKSILLADGKVIDNNGLVFVKAGEPAQ